MGGVGQGEVRRGGGEIWGRWGGRRGVVGVVGVELEGGCGGVVGVGWPW